MEQTQFIGFVGSDANGKINDNNGRFNLRVTVAVTRKFENKTGDQVERTNWYTVFKSFKKEPENLLTHLKKGAKVFVQGEPSYQVKNFDGKISIDVLVSADKLFPVTFKDQE